MAFQVLVGVQVLAGGVDVGAAKELLHRDDVASALQQLRGTSVASPCPAGVSLEDSAKRKGQRESLASELKLSVVVMQCASPAHQRVTGRLTSRSNAMAISVPEAT